MNLYLETITQAILSGFYCWTFFWLVTKRGTLFLFSIFEIDWVIVHVTISIGLIYFITLIFSLTFPSESEILYNNIHKRAFGEYWIGFWIYPFAYCFMTLPMWHVKIRNSEIFRFVNALLIFIVLSLEKYVLIITTIHRDFLDNSIYLLLRQTGLDFLLYMLIFVSINLIVLVLKRLVTNNQKHL